MFAGKARRRQTTGSVASARRIAVASAALALLLSALAITGSARAATWVIRGHGYGHGVGMSQYGAYGLSLHGRGYREILAHYYRHTRIADVGGKRIRVLLGSGSSSVGFSKATRACGKALRRHRRYRFKRSGSGVSLLRAGGRKLASCGRAGTAVGNGLIRVGGRGVYRGKLKAKASGGGLLVINVVGLDDYAAGVVPNEMPSSWSQGALRAQAVAARSYALANSSGGSFDVYDDTRSQVYGGKDSETASTNAACRRTKGEILRYRKHVATTYFFSTSGGETESVQFGFPGASPAPYLKGVDDPYDSISPYHSWTVRYSASEMRSRLSGLFSGRLRRIEVVKRGKSPRIVVARVVGSSDSSRISGLGLQSRLDLRSNWARFRKR
jgi:stage II sporulation protein D